MTAPADGGHGGVGKRSDLRVGVERDGQNGAAGRTAAACRALPGGRIARPWRHERGLSRLRRAPGPACGDQAAAAAVAGIGPGWAEQPGGSRDPRRAGARPQAVPARDRTTAQLEHPGTPAVYDTGVETAPDGSTQLWLVMQLLRGSTLEATLDLTDYVASPPSPTSTGSTSSTATSSRPTSCSSTVVW